jgi:hypothetical protein
MSRSSGAADSPTCRPVLPPIRPPTVPETLLSRLPKKPAGTSTMGSSAAPGLSSGDTAEGGTTLNGRKPPPILPMVEPMTFPVDSLPSHLPTTPPPTPPRMPPRTPPRKPAGTTTSASSLTCWPPPLGPADCGARDGSMIWKGTSLAGNPVGAVVASRWASGVRPK